MTTSEVALPWAVPSAWIERAIEIAVVGAGGTGSHLVAELAALHQTLLDLDHPYGLRVTVYDDDLVTQANVIRSRFLACDVGASKAGTIVNRVNAATGANFVAVHERFSTQNSPFRADLVIGCVDTRQGRRDIHLACATMAQKMGRNLLWLDCGNDSHTGQVVLGEVRPARIKYTDSPNSAWRLPTVTDLFPELLDARLDPADPGPSCSRAEALSRQSLAVNRAAAHHCLSLLTTLLTTGSLGWHGVFFDVSLGRATPLAIDPQAWEAFGYRPEAAQA